MGQPRFIVVEGLDGVGTTTQSERLAQSLRGRDLQVHLTAEPSRGPLGSVLRQHLQHQLTLDPLTTTLLFCADRSDHLDREIRPALQAGATVVCDRYVLSTLAYQGAEGVDRDWILSVSKGVDPPDLTIVLEVPEAERRGRLAGRGTTERYDDPKLADRLRASYLASIDLLRGAGHAIEIVDGSGPPEGVARRVSSLVFG